MAKRLAAYREKRDFRRTPEPSPEVRRRRRGKRPIFVVHKHDATRLHYDLRLEIDGALASWAIPKGPSFDPKVRRLAVETEDHPMSYADFEGRIPDEDYGGGDSLLWDRGTYETEPPGRAGEMRRKGHLEVVLDGEKLKGRFHLVRTRPQGGKQAWLCFKGKDEHADPAYDVVAERPESVASGRRVTRGPVRKKELAVPHPDPLELLVKVWPPMRATLSAASEVEDRGWVYEVKYDGFRALAGLSAGRVALQSRNGLDLAGRFPEVARALGTVKVPEAVNDGEVVVVDAKGRSSFQSLQGGHERLRFVAFDLLWLDGEDLRRRPLEERRDLLESVLANAAPPLVLSERVSGTVEQALEKARKRGLEGLLAKRCGSAYEGRRSKAWRKLKLQAGQELAILGFTPITTGGRELGALLVGYREDGRWKYAGKVGTGFSAKLRTELWKRLWADRIEEPVDPRAKHKGAIWVEPRLVAQVAFTEWTEDGKLRHPSFLGLREDKSPEEIRREEPAPAARRRAAPRREAARRKRR